MQKARRGNPPFRLRRFAVRLALLGGREYLRQVYSVGDRFHLGNGRSDDRRDFIERKISHLEHIANDRFLFRSSSFFYAFQSLISSVSQALDSSKSLFVKQSIGLSYEFASSSFQIVR